MLFVPKNPILFLAAPPGNGLRGSGPASGRCTDTSCSWSKPVKGIAGRICLSRSRVVVGSPLIVATMTLRNSDRSAASVAWSTGSMEYSIVDERGNPVTTGINVDGRPGGKYSWH